jgi:hypothetical protein
MSYFEEIIANAGTNLNTSALALETGNLATLAGKDFATQTTLSAMSAKLTDNTQKTQIVDSTGTSAAITARGQTPSGNVLQVQIGPGDIISNIPVVIDLVNHQIHEGETHHAVEHQLTLNASTIKYGITVPVYNPTISAPHFTMQVDTFDGHARVDIYEGATFTGGTLMTKYNKNRNDTTTDSTTIHTGVTSTTGTMIDSFFVGGGVKSSGTNGIRDEWILKSNTIYRVDVIGGVNPTAAIVSFQYYADLGV